MAIKVELINRGLIKPLKYRYKESFECRISSSLK